MLLPLLLGITQRRYPPKSASDSRDPASTVMEAKVRAFNNLPRPKTTPSGVIPNHWVFGVCHVDIQPAGDLVLAVNPQSQYLIQAGPGQILSSSGTREQAEATIPYLLDAFATPNAMEPSVPTFAPWTWSTLDPNMAKALEDGLKKHGVKPELCKVGVCTAEERDILETARAEMMDRLTGLLQRIERDPVSLGDATKCHSCGMKRECFFKPLMKCGRCGQAYYHSKECQKKDWKSHKSQCHAPGNIDVHTYHNTKAPDDPQACVLMKSLHLQSHPNLGVLAYVSPFQALIGNTSLGKWHLTHQFLAFLFAAWSSPVKTRRRTCGCCLAQIMKAVSRRNMRTPVSNAYSTRPLVRLAM